MTEETQRAALAALAHAIFGKFIDPCDESSARNESQGVLVDGNKNRSGGKRSDRPRSIHAKKGSGERMPSSIDHEWFLSALDSHRRLIHKVCWAYANSADEREDLFQEIAVRLLSAARHYDPSRKLSTWIYRVALNVAIDFHRMRRRRSREQLGFDGELATASGQDQVVTEQLRELRELLDHQPEAERALLLLHLDGNSHSEIGEVLGISESNVGTRLSRLKKSLRQSVEAHEN